MVGTSNPPPPSRAATAAAAAVGGFAGAVLGVIAATSMMGDGDSQSATQSSQATDTQVAEVRERD
ncbi:MAG: hypothetical protein AAGE85_09205 [Pseudomonadota bacterium]